MTQSTQTVQDPQLQANIGVWRQKAIAGTLTLEEAKAAIKALRQGRQSAMEAALKGGKKKSSSPARSADDLLGELGL